MITIYGNFSIDVRCQCPAGYNGPRCQQTARSFRGNGWAWYPALEMCDNSHLSFEFITKKPDGLLLYNGPIVPPEADEIMVSGEQDEISYTLVYHFGGVKTKLESIFTVHRLYIRRAGTWDTAAIDRLRFRHVGIESETEEDIGRRGMAQAGHILEHGGLETEFRN